MRTFYEDKVAKVWYDAQLDYLCLEYISKVPNHNEFVKINQAVLDAFTTLHTQVFVADIRRMGIISLESQNWVLENLLPKMITHLKGKQLYHAQWIDDTEIMSKVSGGNIKNRAKNVSEGLQVIQIFTEPELHEYVKQSNLLV
ncbi:MAG: hypothetical protein AAFX87_20135 [Bacteroidota bacterium]